MSDIPVKLLNIELLNKRNQSETKIKKILLSKRLKSSNLSLSENNIKNYSKQISDKSIEKIKPYKFIKYNIFRDYNNMLKRLNISKIINSRTDNNFNIGNSSFLSRKNNENKTFIEQSNNFSEERNDINKYFNDNNIIKSTRTDTTNECDNYNRTNEKLMLVKPLNLYEKINNNKINRQNKINNIINSLLNENYKKPNLFSKKDENKNKYPIEKMISPMEYIKYNLKKSPLDTSLYKGINNIMKDFGNNNKDYEINLLKKARDMSNNKINISNLSFGNNENNIYKKQYEDMIKQSNYFNPSNFNFNEKNILKKKIKKYTPYKNILEQSYRLYLNKEFGYKNDENKKIKFKFGKNIGKYISFDTRVNNILNLSKQSEINANEKSKIHQKMINNIDRTFNSY